MDQEEQRLEKLAVDLKTKPKFFYRNAIRITTKSANVVPFVLNDAQVRLHDKLQAQLKKKGMVRAIIVKGRQMGGSTYVQARFYHKLWASQKPLHAFILTHEDKATQKLFAMTKSMAMFHPEAVGKPETDTSNANEFKFGHNRASYSVGTAKAKEVGRGSTLQMFHGSEVAFWDNGDKHIASVFQALADTPGSEIILESTANGMGNMFHKLTMGALRGENDFEVIFMPWFWDNDYRVQNVPDEDEWVVTKEWRQYALDNSLDWEQLYWAYKKNANMASSLGESVDEPCWKFKQEYPSNIDEAFQTSGSKAFIPSAKILTARKRKSVVGTGPIILGVDPARVGEEGQMNEAGERKGDFIGVVDRQGNVMGSRICECISPEGSLVTVANKIADIINRIKPDQVNIDIGGLGAGVYDILNDERGFGRILNPVNFGEKPIAKSPTGDYSYRNRRAEMWDNMRQWFLSDVPVQMADSDLLHNDLAAPIMEQGSGCHTDNNGVMTMEPKSNIKKRLGHSPDLGDAAALTFALPTDFLMNVKTAPPIHRERKSRVSGY